MSQPVRYDVAVIGAGTMGMSAASLLTERGAHTLVIDAFDPPHNKGSHHGDTRMIRHAYGEGRAYVSLVKRAQKLWEELDHTSQYPIFKKTGVLGLGPRDSAFLDETIASAKKYDLPLQLLSKQDVETRWPGISIPDDYIGCYETESGLLYSENAIRAYRERATANGAELVMNTPVESLEFHEDGVTIVTSEATFYAKKVIVTVGAWAKQLLPDLLLPLAPTRKVVGWFDADETLYSDASFPSFFVEEDDRMFYGFPSLDGAGLKVGRTDGGQAINPNLHTQDFGRYEADEGDLRHFLETYMPEANGALNQGKTCLYTMSDDHDFIVDVHPEHHNVIIACGFSGHGFKFGSVMGEVLSQLTLDGQTPFDLSRFRLARFRA
ncbi:MULTISPECIES: N-methyl-L-tryptophan oxidase [Exiguobacterium]|uniref:N-methyl-L-tryptophan oxidase n=1 Tax=Exiguobacterium TaxID=33986 RepID=UPI001BEA7142|nr:MULTISPECIES: N-methyl-L-tryptophan oxidase [Exiguobacterium]MCT4777155.1 N-methyl-L-tryptophan oxidase [Exiguobacterium aquaticum]MCT4789351.1 N-methyl-L-tryptophan oxidase [Exiguobacterium mexicanum]